MSTMRPHEFGDNALPESLQARWDRLRIGYDGAEADLPIAPSRLILGLPDDVWERIRSGVGVDMPIVVEPTIED